MLNVAFLVTVYSSRTFTVTVLVVRDLYQYCPYLNLRPHESLWRGEGGHWCYPAVMAKANLRHDELGMKVDELGTIYESYDSNSDYSGLATDASHFKRELPLPQFRL